MLSSDLLSHGMNGEPAKTVNCGQPTQLIRPLPRTHPEAAKTRDDPGPVYPMETANRQSSASQ